MIDLSKIKMLDFIQVRVADSFSLIKTGRGHGESRLYLGSSTKDWEEFFESFKIKCFFTKKDLSNYLDTARFEYEEQQQPYLNDIRPLWYKNKEAVDRLDEQEFFTTTNQPGAYDHARYYISFKDSICNLFRKLALPKITTLLIQKIEYGNERFIWFRPYLSELGNIFENEIIIHEENSINQNQSLSLTEKEQIVKARLGQGVFREGVIKRYQTCIITGIDDERILIASHIKPWSVANNIERISDENGLLLSPTYDKLFDKGFISFKNDGRIILSNYFSDYNYAKLNLKHDHKYKINATSKMKDYLEYHRDVIFMG